MQNSQSEPLPATPVEYDSHPLWTALDLLDPLLLLAVGGMVMLFNHFTPQTLLICLAVLLLPYLLRWGFYGAPSRSTLADVPMVILFCVMTPISVWVTPYFWDKTWPELLRMLWGGAMFMGVINWAWPVWQDDEDDAPSLYRLPARLWLLLFLYLGIGISLALLGLLNMQVVTKLPLVDSLARALTHTTWLPVTIDEQFNPNRVASLLVLYAPLPLAFLLASGRAAANPLSLPGAAPVRRTGWQVGRAFLALLSGTSWFMVRKFFWLALWLFFAGGLLLTQSRAGLLAFLVATLLVVTLTGRQPDGWMRILGGLLLILFLGGMGYFILDLQYTDLMDLVTTTNLTLDHHPTQLTNTDSLSGRTLIWERALYGIADQPLTGLGLGVFDEVAHEPYPALAAYIPGDIHHAHNVFLQTGLDLGLPGMIAFIALVLIAIGSVWRLYRLAPVEGQLSVWVVALLGCFVAFLINNVLDGLTLGARPAIALWMLLGLAIATSRYRPATLRNQPTMSSAS